MKRFCWILILALCLGLLAGCGVEDVLDGMMGPRVPEPTQTPGPTEMPIWTPPVTADPAAAAAPTAPAASGGTAPAGGGALTVADCVADGWTEPGAIPYIKLDTPGAASINAALQETFGPIAADPMWDMHAECAVAGGRVLSVLMVQQANDCSFHTAYNLDLTTGQALTGPEILALLGQDEAALKAKELTVMAEEFTHQYGGLVGQMDQTFYDQQYARTTSIDNAETELLWFGADGQLYFAGRIYAMAGAEYYECALPTGVTF